MPLRAAAFTTAVMAAFMPGASPPEVMIAIFLNILEFAPLNSLVHHCCIMSVDRMIYHADPLLAAFEYITTRLRYQERKALSSQTISTKTWIFSNLRTKFVKKLLDVRIAVRDEAHVPIQ
jgi:hypothetical protein